MGTSGQMGSTVGCLVPKPPWHYPLPDGSCLQDIYHTEIVSVVLCIFAYCLADFALLLATEQYAGKGKVREHTTTTVWQALLLSISNWQLQKFTFFFHHFSSSKGVGPQMMMSLTILYKSFLVTCFVFCCVFYLFGFCFFLLGMIDQRLLLGCKKKILWALPRNLQK